MSGEPDDYTRETRRRMAEVLAQLRELKMEVAALMRRMDEDAKRRRQDTEAR